MRMNGTGEYYFNTIAIEEYSTLISPSSTYQFDVTNDHVLAWDDHFLYGLKGELGYRISSSITTSLSFDYYFTKKGFRPYLVYEDFDLGRYPLATNSDEQHVSSFNRKTFRLTGQLYFTRSLFIISGVEYIIMDMEIIQYSYMGNSVFWHTEDNCVGIVVGIGLERNLSDRFSLVGTTIYSLAEYNGDKLMYGSFAEDFSFDVGGLEMGLGLRFYWR